MKRKSAYEIWTEVNERLENEISHKQDNLKSHEEKWVDTHNRIHTLQIELDLLENNLEIATGRLKSLPKPEPEE